jgi:outer membrane protein assembly factor BamB
MEAHRTLVGIAVVWIVVIVVPAGRIQAWQGDADKQKRMAEINKEIAALQRHTAELQAELAGLQRTVVVHVPKELIPLQPPRADDWPMYGYDGGNTFCNRHERTLVPPLAEVWEVTLGGYLDGVVVSSGIVLAAGGQGRNRNHKVYALDAQNGHQLWTFTLPGGVGGAIGMTPACLGDLAFFGGQSDKNIYAVHLRSGELRWQHGEINSMFSASPKVAEGVLYVNSNQSGLWAFDPKSGTEKWRNDGGRQADIAITGGKLLRPGGAYGGVLVALDAQTGAQSWHHTEGSTSFRLAATDDMVYAVCAGATPTKITESGNYRRFKYDRIAAFNIRDGKKVWETQLKEDAHYGGLLVLGDFLYAATRAGGIYCLVAQNGTIRKERRFVDGHGGLVATSNVLFATSRHSVVALAPDTLETLWATPISGFQELAVANGRLYVAAGSRIVAFANGPRDGEQ